MNQTQQYQLIAQLLAVHETIDRAFGMRLFVLKRNHDHLLTFWP